MAASELTKGLGGVTSLAWHRIFKSRLFIEKNTPVRFQLDIEQCPREKNGIRLSNNLDRWGRRIPIIKWEVDSKDFEAIRTTSHEFFYRWSRAGKSLPRLRPIDSDVTSQKPHDAYHPVGVCRMGLDSRSVVDLNLKCHAINNLSILSTAVFPTAGSANPTFSMLCLGEALSIQLGKELS